ncbi:RNA polymerase sigma-E factor [Nocardioides dokdonensis FR1436]|uniref:RNA polymerase sigma-E factor n=1 Tax=Nocardioides dokdonensis FR1436 TaxID=1300347 RepID=A0A1A9GKL0_9ACTN|nr:SigE family RNA polymerase sigma factor [Nocardioides dokdonensis]ANH38839.1 RNA polymerase sigma-E factor [Nocardioides dokdonensis FR1436]
MTRPPTDAQFSEMVHASWPALYRTAYLLLGDAAEAEDLVQTALTKTYATWSKVRSVDAAPGYARTVLVNTAASWFRKRSWRNERPTEVLPEAGTHTDEALRPTLLDALTRLAPRQRAVVVLRYYEDMSVAQTAAALDINEGTVKSQTSHALERLRALLGEDLLTTTTTTTGGTHD